MVHDVSGGIIHTTPDSIHVQNALESFCVRYQQYDENIRKEIKYVWVSVGWLSLLNTTDDGYVWEATSDARLLAQCLLDIPPISVLLDCNGINVEVIGLRSPREPYHTVESLNGYGKYCEITKTLQTYRKFETLVDWSKCYRGNNEVLEKGIECFSCTNVASVINALSAYSPFPFHYLLSHYGEILNYLNIEALNMSKWLDYFNVSNNDGNLPLHIICQVHLGSEKQMFLMGMFSRCNVSAKNKKGETPFQISCDRNDVETLKYLMINTPCDMYHYGKTNNDNIEIASRLVKQVFADSQITVPSLVTVVPGDTLLHVIARIPYSEDAIDFLVRRMEFSTCKMNSRKEFPLHVACRTGQSAHSLQALSNCSVNQKNVEENTPFDILVENHPMRFDLMVCVMKLPSFSIDSEHSSLELLATQHFCESDSPYFRSLCFDCNILHIALLFNKVSFVQIVKKEYPNKFQQYVSSSNSQKELPFHIAAKIRNKEAISLVFGNRNPNVVTFRGNTALHEACLHSVGTEKDLEAVKYLIDEVKCDPHRCNKDGNTALHLVCRKGCTDIVNFLLNKVKVNPDTKNKDGCTPLMLTSLNNHQIIRLLIENGAETSSLYVTYNMFFEKYSSKDPPPTPLNIIVAGKPSSGKTTIIETLKSEGSSEKVEAEEHTAGIIPSSYDSKSFGMTAWYDLAGQSEYYASHEAVLHTIMSSSSPLILLLVDCRKPQELIQQDILYWLHFFKNQVVVNATKAEPHLMIVFSFADEVLPERIKSTIFCCKISLTSFINKASLRFIGFVALDCRNPNSTEIDELRAKIGEGAKELRDKVPIDFLLHCFYAFLVRSFLNTPVVTIEQVKSLRYEWISSGIDSIENAGDEDDQSEASLYLEELDFEDESETDKDSPAKLIPNDNKEILCLCEKLHDKGHIIIIRNAVSIEKSWLIINKEILLSTINGTLFAPSNFRQHYKDISSSTGVVKLSTIADIACHSYDDIKSYDINMLIGFLVHIEYCQKITDKNVLKLLSPNLAYQSSDEYLFFPGLVSISKPDDVWTGAEKFDRCGWVLQTVECDSFFTPRFVQVLLLRVAFGYSFPLESRRIGFPNITLCRACTVWKNGIYWRTETRTECLLEVTEECQAIVLMFRSLSQLEDRDLASQCFLRSSLISEILGMLEEFCPALKVEECFCHPDDIQYPPPKCEDMSLYSLTSIARAICHKYNIVICNNPRMSGLKLEDLIQFEPLAFCDIGQVYHPEKEEECVSESFLFSLAESVGSSPHSNSLKCIFQTQSGLTSMQKYWSKDILSFLMKSCVGKTYKDLRSCLSQYSIFGSRNPQVSYLCKYYCLVFYVCYLQIVGKCSIMPPEKSCLILKSSSAGQNNSVVGINIPLYQYTIILCCVSTDIVNLENLIFFKCHDNQEVNILEEVGVQYHDFGIRLLQDSYGSKVSIIEKVHKSDILGIVREIVKLWLNGEGLPVSWESLVSVLRSIKLGRVADVICNTKHL